MSNESFLRLRIHFHFVIRFKKNCFYFMCIYMIVITLFINVVKAPALEADFKLLEYF